MKKLLSLFVTLTMLCPGCALAQTLAELKAQATETVTLRIDGETVAVPMALPEGDTLCILRVRVRDDLNAEAVAAVYPSRETERIWLEDGLGNLTYSARCDSLNVDVCPEDGRSARYGMPWNEGLPDEEAGRFWGTEMPEDCSVPAERPAQILREILDLAGAGDLDVRVLRQFGSSRAYAGAFADHFEGERRASYLVLDKTRPIAGMGGMWLTEFEQWIEGAPVFAAYYTPTIDWNERITKGLSDRTGSARFLHWPEQYIRMWTLSENDLKVCVYMLFEPVETLARDVELAGLDEVVQSVQARIDAGDLRSVTALRLGYTNLVTTKSDGPGPESGRDHVLFPAWQVLGYDRKDADSQDMMNFRAITGREVPREGEVLTSDTGAAFVRGLELRIDATSGQVLEDYRYE